MDNSPADFHQLSQTNRELLKKVSTDPQVLLTPQDRQDRDDLRLRIDGKYGNSYGNNYELLDKTVASTGKIVAKPISEITPEEKAHLQEVLEQPYLTRQMEARPAAAKTVEKIRKVLKVIRILVKHRRRSLNPSH